MATIDTQTKILEIQVKYEEAIKQIASYREAIEALRAKQKELKKDLSDGKITTEEYHRSVESSKIVIGQYTGAVQVLSKQVSNQIKVEKEQNGSLVQLRAALSNATRAYDELSRSEREGAKGQELKKKINDITTELKGAEQETLRFYRNVGNYPEAKEGLAQVESGVKKIGAAFLALAGITGFKDMMNQVKEVGSSFEDQMAKVRAVTNASTSDFAMMRAEAERLGSSTRYTATEAAEALENLTRNGLTSYQATTVLQGTLQLAQANVIDLGEAADIVTGQLNSFHLGVDQVGRVGDVMSKVCATSATNITLLSESLKNCAPLAYTLKISMEETNSALAILANNNIKGADAGTALKQTLVGLSTQTEKTRKVYEKYGINIDENVIAQKGLIGTLKILNDSGIMESSTKMQDLSDIFGRRAVGSVMALLNSIESLDTYMTENLGVGGVNAVGTVDRMFEQSFSDFTIASDSLKSAWEGLLITIWSGGERAKAQQAISDKAYQLDAEYQKKKQELEEQYGDTDEAQAKLEEAKAQYDADKAALLAEANEQMADAGSGMAESLTGPLQMITEIIQYVRENLNELGTMLASVLGAISLMGVVKMVQTAMAKMKTDVIANAEQATNRVNTLAQQEATQRANVEKLKTQYENTSGAERQLIANKLTIQKQQLAETEKMLTKAKTEEIKLMEQAAATSTATGWKGAMQTAGIAIKGFVTTAKTAFKGFILTAVLSLAFELIMKLWDAFNSGEGVIGKLGSSIGSFVKNSLNKLKQVIVDVINWFIEFYNDSVLVRGVVATIGSVFKVVWTILKTGIKSIGNSFKLLGDIIAGVAQALKGLFTLSWDDAVAGVKKLGTAVTNFYSNQKEVAIDTAKEIKDDVLDSFANMDTKLQKVSLNAPHSSDRNGTGSGTGYNSGGVVPDPNAEIPGGGAGGGAGGGGKGGKGKGNKAAEAQRKAEKAEMEALAELQNELYKIEKDSYEKRYKEISVQYDKRISKLRTKLATEKNLTEKARKAINDLILVIEQEKQDALEKFDKEEHKKAVEALIKLNEDKLKLIQKGTEDELKLRLANLQAKHELDVQERNDAIALAQERVDKLQSIYAVSTATMTDEQRAAYDRQLADAQAALALQQESLKTANEQYERDKTAIEEQNEADRVSRQKQALANQIQEMQNAEDERLLMLKYGHEMTDEEYEADKERKLERIGGFQAQKLEMEETAAEEEYNRLVERGQLSTQTEEQYNQELNASKQNWLQKQKAINDAYVKQEEAKYQAMKSLTSSLTGLLDTLGESNKAFAVMSKVITLAQIAIDTGKAISAGIASASAVPFPGNIAAIATTVATVIANIATAISTVKSAKFAEGGKVVGAGTGTSDSIPAMLSNGEYVMTERATRMFEPLLSAMNGIGAVTPIQVAGAAENAANNEMLTESFSTAVSEIKPVVSVVEISEAQNRVATIENLDNF